MTAHVCFTMDNLGDAADLGRGVINSPRIPGQRPAFEEGFPALLDLYRKYQITITHFIEGWSAQEYPEAIEKILAEGHSLGMHGWQHEKWSTLSYDQMLEIATRATEAIEKSGKRPKAFRAPGGKRTRFTSEILTTLGYEIDASLCPSGQDGGEISQLTRTLWSVPYQWTGVDASHWLWQKRSCEEVEAVWKETLQQTAANNGYYVFIWHPHVMGISEERRAVGERILQFVTEHDEYKLITLDNLLSRYQNNIK